MARPEAQALGGFYPTPPELFPALSSLIRVLPSERDTFVADLCAGDGTAIVGLVDRWALPLERGRRQIRIYACELEQTRYYSLRNKLTLNYHDSVEHGDAFLLRIEEHQRVHVLWHNPPYDLDRAYKRTEERWLRRFGPMVAVGGALLHFVPFYSLEASADTIASLFDRVWCFRVPDPHWDAFKQVILVGRRRHTLGTPDPKVAAQVRTWSGNAESIPVLPLEGFEKPLVEIASIEAHAPSWKLTKIDIQAALADYEPWTVTDRSGRKVPVENIEPADAYETLMSPRLRLACPPRAAHVAMAAGAGLLSGARLTPDEGRTGPELLLKGVHRRTFRHLGWKTSSQGEQIAEERQHYPELQLSILDVRAGKYHRLTPSMEPTGHEAPERWSVGDLIERYSASMLQALRDRCELLYDPLRPEDRAMPLPDIPLFDGQADGVRTILRLLAQPDRAAVLLGQIGVGKTRMSLVAAYHYLGGRGKVLVVCPTSLLPEWKSEVGKVLGARARVHFLESVHDVDRFAALPSDGFEIAVLSKEPAKLSHAWAGVARCGTCGTVPEASPSKLAETRATCPKVHHHPANSAARLLARLTHLGGVLQEPQLVAACKRVGGRILQRIAGREGDWAPFRPMLHKLANAFRRVVLRTVSREMRKEATSAFWSFLNALGDDDLIVSQAMRLFRATLHDRESYGEAQDVRNMAVKTLLLLPPSSPLIESTFLQMDRYRGVDYANRSTRLVNDRDLRAANLARRRGLWKETYQHNGPTPYGMEDFGNDGDVPIFMKHPRGSTAALSFAIERLAYVASWIEEECGDKLYQAIPEPRIYPLARYILRRHPDLFDFIVFDEFHKFAHGDSAQSRAAQRLLSLRMRRRVPVIALTGSVMNGYARTLFILLWHFSSAFRMEFEHDDVGEFERRYGFLVQVVEQFDKDKKRVAFGSNSDRVVKTSTRTTGAAPGVLPTAIMRFLLPMAAVVQLSDLEKSLPACHEKIVYCKPTKEQSEAASTMQRRIITAIAGDRFKAGRAGKLFGALGHLPRYYDHATDDLGNTEDGSWCVGYPSDVEMSEADRVLHKQPGIPASTLLPKEERLLAEIRPFLASGRNVVVASVRKDLAARLARLLREHTGLSVALLDAQKVSAKKRRDWVTDVKEQGTRILVCNPAALPEGLNVLVGHFTVVCMFDDPNNDPTLLRQFRGRFVRIGQTEEVHFLLFVYQGTIQEDANDLLQKKRVIAEATDGLDASASFEVAGVGEATFFENDLAKFLATRLTARA